MHIPYLPDKLQFGVKQQIVVEMLAKATKKLFRKNVEKLAFTTTSCISAQSGEGKLFHIVCGLVVKTGKGGQNVTEGGQNVTEGGQNVTEGGQNDT